jgi:hypothetical protein
MTPQQIEAVAQLRDDLALLCHHIAEAHDEVRRKCVAGLGPPPVEQEIQELHELQLIAGELAAVLARARRQA